MEDYSGDKREDDVLVRHLGGGPPVASNINVRSSNTMVEARSNKREDVGTLMVVTSPEVKARSQGGGVVE